MPFYTADYTRDTMHLTRDEHGGYILLLIACWNNGGRLLNKPGHLATIARATPAEWKRLAPVLKRFFRVEGRWLVHKRVVAELEKAARLSGRRASAGAKGAEARWGGSDEPTTRSERLAAARRLATHTADEWDALVDVLGRQCVRCQTPAAALHGGRLTKDHIQPIYQGGSDGIENLQPLCRNCNASKGAENRDLRAAIRADWREALAKRLAKRLANASQTPAPARVMVTTTEVRDIHYPSREGAKGDSGLQDHALANVIRLAGRGAA
jgi:uncharacterized protein YdaU (DUF1376 family)